MTAISIQYVLLQQFHVLRKRKSSPLKRADQSPSLWSPSLLQRVQHVVLADIEPHTKEQVVPAGLHKEEAARAQVRAHCHCLWHGRVWEPLHSAQCHMLTVHLETKCKSKVRCQKAEKERKEYWFCADHLFLLVDKSVLLIRDPQYPEGINRCPSGAQTQGQNASRALESEQLWILVLLITQICNPGQVISLSEL